MDDYFYSNKSSKKESIKLLMKTLKPFLCLKKIEKKESLLTLGDLCNKMYFVRSGAVKQFYVSEGKEFIQNFFFEGDIAALFNNFLNQNIADSYLEAIEGTELWVFTYNNYKAVCSANPEFKTHLTILMSNINTNRVNLLLLSDGMMRYKKFIEDEPKILDRVPHYLVASYLGMTPETLYRIRKKIKKHVA
jgi:CRP-like cAMP-binding protein